MTTCNADHYETSADLSRPEQTLLICLGLAVMNRAGALLDQQGMAASSAQFVEMREFAERVLTGTIIALREPGDLPTPGEIGQTLAEIAEGAILGVVGIPESLKGRSS